MKKGWKGVAKKIEVENKNRTVMKAKSKEVALLSSSLLPPLNYCLAHTVVTPFIRI